MRGRPVAVQGAVAAGALALAAAVWLSPPKRGAPGEVPVAPLGHGQVKAVHWDDGSHQVDVSRAGDADRTVWVRVATSPSLQAPDGGVADGGVARDGGLAAPGAVPDAGARPTALRADAGVRGRPDAGPSDLLKALKEAPPPPPRELRGNDAAAELLERLSPPMAIRDLGIASPERRAALGLEASSKRLRLDTVGGSSLQFVVSTPPGASGSYLLDAGGRLWLVQESLIQDLSAALSRLVDRRLHAFRADEPDALQLQLDGRSRSFVIRKVQGNTRVAPAENPDAPSPEATLWAERVWRLAPIEILGRGETPRDGTPVVAVRVEYGHERRPMGYVEVGKAGSEWYARTEHTAGWIRLPAQSGTLREQAERLEAGVPSNPR
ncbi:MAG TPA: hypothetical protein VMH40_00540 [Myxococcaceae bacterium]|nr:hypothetical protein [Myxococcaceae bacterium]